MDLTALVNPTMERLFGFGVLGIAVFWLAILYAIERHNRRQAEAAAHHVREQAAAKLEEVQAQRVKEMRLSISSSQEGSVVITALQSMIERRLEAIEKTLDSLSDLLQRRQ